MEEMFYDIYYEINYIYHNAANKEFAIVSELSFVDFISRESILNEYEKAKKTLTELGIYNDFKHQLNSLYMNNLPVANNDEVVCNSVENILLTIKSQLS
jgi:hypothetical protein